MKGSNLKKKTKRERVENWLIKHQKIFSILALENKLGFPKNTLHKFLNSKRKLSTPRINKIDKLIQELLFSYEDNEESNNLIK